MLGGGQLGQMFCHAAQLAGVKTHVFCPVDGEPATQVCDHKTIAAYSDLAAVEKFAQSVDAVTYEFENVPAATAAACARYAPVRPGQQVLAVAQDRIVEKTTLQSHGIPVGPFAKVQSLDELRAAAKQPWLQVVADAVRLRLARRCMTAGRRHCVASLCGCAALLCCWAASL